MSRPDSMRSLFLLVVSLLCFIESFSGREVSDVWSVSRDQQLIEASLQKALRRVNNGESGRALREKVSNIVCQTQVLNGLKIKLDFKLKDQQWQCSLYKSFVNAVDIQWERCLSNNEEDEDTVDEPVEEPKKGSEELDADDEAYIDEKSNRNSMLDDESEDASAVDEDDEELLLDGKEALIEDGDADVDADDPVVEIQDENDDEEDDNDDDEDYPKSKEVQ
jgi:hypothetical protein